MPEYRERQSENSCGLPSENETIGWKFPRQEQPIQNPTPPAGLAVFSFVSPCLYCSPDTVLIRFHSGVGLDIHDHADLDRLLGGNA